MSALSIQLENSIFSICANPIFPLTELVVTPEAEFAFEVFEDDSDSLRRQLGQIEHYALDGSTFWAKLSTLEPCASTHPGLALLRHKPTLRGVMIVERVTYDPQAGVQIN